MAVLLLLVTSLPLASAGAQYPRSVVGRFEVTGFDFRAAGGWRQRVTQLRAIRAGDLRGGTVRGHAPAIAGTMRLPVVPITFRGLAPPFAAREYERLLFADAAPGRPYTLRGYYHELSGGRLTVEGRVFDWVIADSADRYYEDGCHGIGVLAPCPRRERNRFGALLLGTLAELSAAPGADALWAAFDNDGPDGHPNSGDDDGYVDVLVFLQAERDGACPGSPNIWAHRFRLSGWNHGVPLTTRTPRAGHPGEFLKLDDYIVQSAVGGATACDPLAPMPVGTVAHETGHALGLPDLYDTDIGNPLAGSGIGEWGLMGSGNYATPLSPARMEAWSLVELGWAAVDSLAGGRRRELAPISESGTVFYVPVPDTEEYFLLENRQARGSDTAQMNPAFRRPKGPGLLVWHVDGAVVRARGLDADNRVNSGGRYGVALVQADGRAQLSTPRGENRGDPGDPFPGSTLNREFCRHTAPAAVSRTGAFVGFCLDSLEQLPGGAVRFRFTSYLSVFDSGHRLARIGVNGRLLARLERVLVPGEAVRLTADSLQAAAGGRSRLEFRGWSNGARREQTILARDLPDTIGARFAAAHRLRVVTDGPVSVRSDRATAAELAAGSFFAEGAVVRLEVRVPAGAIFGGWRGDTAAPDSALELRMSRPFDLTAATIRVGTVAIESAVGALLGTVRLSPAEERLLDAAGNRNGRYDAGDFLAALRRRVPPP